MSKQAFVPVGGARALETSGPTPPGVCRRGDTYTVKALWDETGRTEVVAVTRDEAVARALARQHSRTRWFSAVYVTNGRAGVRAAFKKGSPA